MKPTFRSLLAVVVLALAALGVSGLAGARGGAAPRAEGTASGDPPAFVRIERNGWRYEFHAVTGAERLHPVGERGFDDHASDRPSMLLWMRLEAAREAGVPDLQSLRERHREAAERLRQLGYL